MDYLDDPLMMDAECMVGCKPREETGDLNLEERRDGEDLQLTYLFLWPDLIFWFLLRNFEHESQIKIYL